MNLNSFQIRKICNLYALTGMCMECININRSGKDSEDKLSKISQWEDWSRSAQSCWEAPTWKWTVSMCVNTFFLKQYLTFWAALAHRNALHGYLTPAPYLIWWTCTLGWLPVFSKVKYTVCHIPKCSFGCYSIKQNFWLTSQWLIYVGTFMESISMTQFKKKSKLW